MKVSTLEHLLIEEVKDLYDAEKQMVKALPKLVRAAASPRLKDAFSTHLEETRHHVERLGEVFKAVGAKAVGKSCPAMKGLIEEGTRVIELDALDELRDAALIGAAQRVEHYEIAAYGTARTIAEHLGNADAAALLQQTLDEERSADEKLTGIALEILEVLADGSGPGAGGQHEVRPRTTLKPRTYGAGNTAGF